MSDSSFYTKMQVNDFEKGRRISFSNPDCLSEYEAELQARGLDYKIITGAGMYGIEIIICKPEDVTKHRVALLREIERTREVLRRQMTGLELLDKPPNNLTVRTVDSSQSAR